MTDDGPKLSREEIEQRREQLIREYADKPPETEEEAIRRIVDSMPPLVGEYRRRVLAILRDTRGTGIITHPNGEISTGPSAPRVDQVGRAPGALDSEARTPDYSNIPAAVRAELELLTPEQVCELLQVSRQWLYDSVEKRGFPHIKLGRQLRFRPKEVSAWLADRRR
jgi:excisionase family DNA binding protein